MDSIYEISCPYCRTPIRQGDASTMCSSCGMRHHTTCWNMNSGCTNPACRQQYTQVPRPGNGDVCRNCGMQMPANQPFCPNCGVQKQQQEPQTAYCGNCGTVMTPGISFCSQCGAPSAAQADFNANPAISQYNAATVRANRKKSRAPLIIGIVSGVVVLLIALAVLLLMPRKPSSVTLSKSSVTLERGGSVKLTYTLSPQKAKDENTTWKSSDKSVATVSGGVVKAVAPGTCTITVTTENGKTDTCKVTVTMPAEEKKVLGKWNVTYGLDLKTYDGSSWLFSSWYLQLNSDNTGYFYAGTAGNIDFAWSYTDVTDDGDYLYVTSVDGLYFAYIKDKQEIWLYLKGDSINYCFTCK